MKNLVLSSALLGRRTRLPGAYLLLLAAACQGGAPAPPARLMSYESLSPEKMELIQQLEDQRDILNAQNIADFAVSEDGRTLYFITTRAFELLTNENKMLLIEAGMFWRSLENTENILLLHGRDYRVLTSFDKMSEAYKKEE